jgi:vitamin B12 transporter
VPPLGYLFDPYSGNPNLRPETAETQEFGLQWAAGSHRLRSTWFDTRTRDLLLYDFNTWQFGNVSRVKNQGLETSYSGRFHMTDLRASLSLQDPINETTGLQLVRRAKTLASVSVSQSLGLWTLGGSVRYTGARPDVAGVPELPSNVLVDLTARYVLSPDWTAFGRIENFTDSRFQTAFGYNQLPRTFTIGLSWKMKPVKP